MDLEATKAEIVSRFEAVKARVNDLGKKRSELDKQVQTLVDELKAIQGEYRVVDKMLKEKESRKDEIIPEVQ